MEIWGEAFDDTIQRDMLQMWGDPHKLWSPERRSGMGQIFRKWGRAAGGPVEGPLQRRLREARERKEAYLVGEKRPELFIGDSGKLEIVGQHGPEVRTFPESGRIEPHVPEWIRRGMAKDLTGREGGGGVRGPRGRFAKLGPRGAGQFALMGDPYTDLYPDALRTPGPAGGVLVGGPETVYTTGRPPRPPRQPVVEPAPLYKREVTGYEGTLAAEPGSGLAGRKRVRDAFAGEREAIMRGQLSPSGGVQRVFVVNWPAGGGFGGGGLVNNPAGAQRAAGPIRFANDADADRFAKQVGGHIGRELSDLLGETVPAAPREPQAETSTRQKLSPLEQLENRLGAGESVAELRARNLEVRSSLSETQQQIPVRSLAPAVGQIFATIFGGRGEALARLAKARDLTDQSARAASVYGAQLTKLNDLIARRDKGEEGLTDQIQSQNEATEKAHKVALAAADDAEAAAKHADSLGLKLRVLTANTLGIVGGTLAFGATLGAAQIGLEGVQRVLGPVIERMSGFSNTSAAQTSALADNTKALGGAADAAFAAAAAQAGIGKATYGTIAPILEQRASIEAGNKTLQQGLDLLHTYEEAQRRGGAQGLRATTGGALGTILGGTASTQELIKNELNSSDATFGSSDPAQIARLADLRRRRDQFSQPGAFHGPQVVATLDAQIKAIEGTEGVLKDRIDFFNDALQRGGSNLKFMAGAADDTAKAFASAADRAGFTELGQTARGINKVVLVDQSGKPVFDGKKIEEALGAINLSQQTPDVDVLIRQLTQREIPAQRARFAAEGAFSRMVNSAQFALQQAASPTPGLAGGPSFSSGLVAPGDKAARAAGASYRREVGGAISFINSEIEKGHQALIDLVPANLQPEFSSILKDITATGKQISAIQTSITQQQTNLAVAEYNNQLRIARRQLADARDIQAGIRGEVKNTLGGLEGQNIAIQRQLQLLGFELQQRQINFKLAVAGFVAPGTTPEERAARIEAAKQEAAFAQKQLDLQKQLAANQFKGVQISVSRDVTDLLAQINLLQQGRAVTINTAQAARALDILNKKQALLVERAQSYIEEGVKITQAAIQATYEVQRQTGKGFALILSKTAAAWGIFGEQAKAILDALTGTAPARNSSGSPDDRDRVGAATGILGDTLGPTQLTVGEVKGEKVAVLKNPKLVPSSTLAMPGGGGGGTGGGLTLNMTVVVTGNQISDQADIERLTDRIAEKVERKFMDKTSLLGLRRRL